MCRTSWRSPPCSTTRGECRANRESGMCRPPLVAPKRGDLLLESVSHSTKKIEERKRHEEETIGATACAAVCLFGGLPSLFPVSPRSGDDEAASPSRDEGHPPRLGRKHFASWPPRVRTTAHKRPTDPHPSSPSVSSPSLHRGSARCRLPAAGCRWSLLSARPPAARLFGWSAPHTRTANEWLAHGQRRPSVALLLSLGAATCRAEAANGPARCWEERASSAEAATTTARPWSSFAIDAFPGGRRSSAAWRLTSPHGSQRGRGNARSHLENSSPARSSSTSSFLRLS